MSNSTTPNPAITPPAARPNRPLSEALLNEKWDHCLSTTLIRGTLGASFGIIFPVLLFKRRSWPVFTGAGFGIGRAWEECDAVSPALRKRVCTTRRRREDLHTPLRDAVHWLGGAICVEMMRGKFAHVSRILINCLQSFKRASAPSRDGLRVLRP
nr:hypothetical protein B0A51_11357 [Rachicladosporium sp. CCFEE 5018]